MTDLHDILARLRDPHVYTGEFLPPWLIAHQLEAFYERGEWTRQETEYKRVPLSIHSRSTED